MKKIFLIILLTILSVNQVSAGGCLIKSDSSKELKKYLKNYRNILNNISNEAKASTKKTKAVNDFNTMIYNYVFDFENYFKDIDFFTFKRKITETPKEIERDYKMLKGENDFVKELTYFMQKNNLKNIGASKNICSGVSNCTFKEGDFLGDILKDVVENNEKIRKTYIKITAGEHDFRRDEFILVNTDTFFDDLITSYGKEAIESCSEKVGFFKKVKEETQKIFTNENSAKEGIKKWKEAWAMVSGINTVPKEEREALEKDLLKKELARQGVPSEAQESMLKNLDAFNKSGSFSLNNNFIANTFKQIETEFKNEFQSLKQEVTADFIENHMRKTKTTSGRGGGNEEKLEIPNLLKSQNNSDNTKEIKARIHRLYVESSSYSALSKYNNDNLKNRIINTHIELSNSIKKLNDTCKMAVKICNQQDAGNGDCGDCNW